MKYKIITGVILMLVSCIYTGKAQVYERTRQESKSFKVYENTQLEIYNKYGNIHLFTWDKDSVRVDVDLQVKASKESKVDKIFDYIDFEFSGSKYYIIARTKFRQNKGSFWSEVSDLANTVFSGNNKAQIDFNVYLPADIHVKLENKFGNIYCTDHQGDFEATISNGDLKANDLTGKTKLDLSFGNAGINYIASGRIEASYLEMDLGRGDELQIESKSSTYNIRKAESLNIQSRRDKFFVDEVKSLSGDCSFTYLTLEEMMALIQLKTEYGELKIKRLDPQFKMFELQATYTDVIIQVNHEVNTNIQVLFSESTGIYYPDSFSGLTIEKAKEKGKQSTLSGIIGIDKPNNPKIEITIQSGKVALQEAIQLF